MNNPFNLNNKRCVVTGAASGIGRATAFAISNAGGEVELLDINLEGLEKTAKNCEKSTTTQIDLADTGSIKDCLHDIVKKRGKLNCLVHCAGIPYISPLRSIKTDQLEKVLKINTIAALELSKVFSQSIVSGGGENSIVLISSVYAHVGSSCNVGYSLSKAALHGMVKSLSIELAPKKIRVNCIAPGFIETEMKDSVGYLFDDEHDAFVKSLHPLGLGSADDVAYGVQYLLSDAAKWITGTILNIDGGFTAQ